MKCSIFFLLIYQFLTLNAFANGVVRSSKVNRLLEVEELAVPENMPIEYFSTKQATANKRALNSFRKLTLDIDLIKSGLMVPHTDPVKVMSIIHTQPIFWGISWYNPKVYTDKIIGLNKFYKNFDDSTYANTVSEYLPSKLIHSYTSPIISLSTASQDPQDVLAKVCKVAGLINSDVDYYPVYVDIKRGSASYCAYHSAGTCNGRPVQFAFFFNIDDDPGCDPRSPYAPRAGSVNSQISGTVIGVGSKYQQSQGLAALANVSAHELVEVITDPAYFPLDGLPYWGGWFDAFGAENADKCAWTFGPSNTGLSPGTVSVGGFDWKIQGTWSNEAQVTGEGGYPTRNGLTTLVGCVTGS